MVTIVQATKGIASVEGDDPAKKEMVHKNAALWIQYSNLSLGRNSDADLLDNGGVATVPAGMAAHGNTTAQEKDEWTKEGVIL
ncbi:MAG: hypothetical protein Q7T80_16385 [Methanoregula sp.]|nr:hypothetical protein [Methanoregula sp.]